MPYDAINVGHDCNPCRYEYASKRFEYEARIERVLIHPSYDGSALDKPNTQWDLALIHLSYRFPVVEPTELLNLSEKLDDLGGSVDWIGYGNRVRFR